MKAFGFFPRYAIFEIFCLNLRGNSKLTSSFILACSFKFSGIKNLPSLSRLVGIISENIEKAVSIDDWYNITNDLADWSIKFDILGDQGLGQLLEEQWKEANVKFTKFIDVNYHDLLNKKNDVLMSPGIISSHIKKNLDNNEKIVLIMMDCLRSDQLKSMRIKIKST